MVSTAPEPPAPGHNGPLSQPAAAGPLSRETFLRAMLASASQPVLTPNVRIVEGGDQYVDGGVREVAPLKMAIDNGAEAIYAIVLSPAQEAPSNATYTFIVDTLLRTLNLLLQEVMMNDVETAVLYNRAIRYLRAARTKAATLLPPAQVEAIFDTLAPPNPFAGKTLLDLYVIRPAEALPTDGLTFEPLVMSQMMTMGREAAEQVLQSGPLVS